jgi:hypothetical protein
MKFMDARLFLMEFLAISWIQGSMINLLKGKRTILYLLPNNISIPPQ